MKKFYLFFLLLFFCTKNLVLGQATVSTGIPNGTVSLTTTGPIGVTFIIENLNSFAIQITDVDAFRGSVNSGIPLSLYYHTTSLSGPILATDPGWTLVTTTTPSSVTSNGIYPTFNNISVVIPANTVYRFMMLVNGTGSVGNLFGSATGVPNSTIAGNVRLGTGTYQIASQNVCYHGGQGNLNSSSYAWAGTITYTAFTPCVFPPNAGNAVVSNSSVCTGSNITLDIVGNTGGSGQTYQWEEAFILAGPYTAFGSPQSFPTLITPALSPYYRCLVTCNGFIDYSQPVSVSLNPGLIGTYTIDPSLPVSGTNFQSFSAAISSLSCGVLGPVTINAAIGSGPYNEQLIIPSIPGASATNTVTINGNGVTLQATAPVSSNRSVIRLNGADHITINNFNLVSLDATYGWGVQLINGADSNTISNCTINLNAVTSTTQSNSGGIVISGSSTNVTTDGSASFNTFINNTITGGYQGIIINGGTGAVNAVGNIVIGNDIKDYYENGIEITNTDSIVIANNQIHRPTRLTTNTTSSGIEIGDGCQRSIVNANAIYDTHVATTVTTGTAYAIFSNASDALVGFENKIANNIIYKFGSLTGTIYALYNSNSDGAHYYHNTVVLDNTASTSGVTRGFFQTGVASNIAFKNNIIFISRGGSGIKFCIYFASASSIASDYNDLINTSTSGTNGIGYYGGNFLTLATWKTANSGAYDQASANLNPSFVNAGTGNLFPTNVSMDNLGTPVGITTDYFGLARSSTVPDMGAIEFPTSPLEIKLGSFTARLKDVDVALAWNVFEEKNIVNYSLERSVNGSEFETIGLITASGNTSYSYSDNGIAEKHKGSFIFYRLKITEMDGKQTYSSTVSVKTENFDEIIKVFPNPFTKEVNIELNADASGSALIKLTDALGRVVVNDTRFVQPGLNKMPLYELEELPSGIYSLNVEYNGKHFTDKIMK